MEVMTNEHIPEGWQRVIASRLFSLTHGEHISREDFTTSGFKVFGGNGSRGFYEWSNCPANSLIIGMHGALCGNIHYSHEKCWVTEHASWLTIHKQLELYFLKYFLEHLNLNSLSIGSAQLGLNEKIIRRQTVILPSLEEQQAIAAYLDRETAKIDQQILMTQKLMSHLEEQVKSLIFNVIISPNGNRKKLKYIMRLTYGSALSVDEREDGNIAVYGSGGQIGRHNFPNTDSPCIIVGRKGSVGKLHYSNAPVFVIDTAFFTDSNTTSENLRWLYYTLMTADLEYSQDTGVPGLSRDYAINQWVKVPTENEQVSIANRLDAALSVIDDQIERLEAIILTLKEKRAALITAAVTGQLEVT